MYNFSTGRFDTIGKCNRFEQRLDNGARIELSRFMENDTPNAAEYGLVIYTKDGGQIDLGLSREALATICDMFDEHEADKEEENDAND